MCEGTPHVPSKRKRKRTHTIVNTNFSVDVHLSAAAGCTVASATHAYVRGTSESSLDTITSGRLCVSGSTQVYTDTYTRHTDGQAYTLHVLTLKQICRAHDVYCMQEAYILSASHMPHAQHRTTRQHSTALHTNVRACMYARTRQFSKSGRLQRHPHAERHRRCPHLNIHVPTHATGIFTNTIMPQSTALQC